MGLLKKVGGAIGGAVSSPLSSIGGALAGGGIGRLLGGNLGGALGGIAGGLFGGQMFSDAALGEKPDFSGSYADVAEMEKKRDALAKEGKTKQANLDEMLRQNLVREAAAKGDLSTARQTREKTIQDELQRRLQETGIDANKMRGQLTEAQSDRGLLRSSFTQKGFEDIAVAEQQDKADLRLQADVATEDLRQQEKDVVRGIENERAKQELNFAYLDLNKTEDQRFYLDSAAAQNRLDIELTKQGIASDRRKNTVGIIGGLAGAAGMLLGGR